jgi:hypothetical protein
VIAGANKSLSKESMSAVICNWYRSKTASIGGECLFRHIVQI